MTLPKRPQKLRPRRTYRLGKKSPVGVELDADVAKWLKQAERGEKNRVNDLVRGAMLKEQAQAIRRRFMDMEAREMAQDPASLEEEAFFMDFQGDVGDEPW